MPVSLNAQIGGEQQMFDAMLQKTRASLRVAMPGIIQSFNAENVTAVVQLAIEGVNQDSNDQLTSLSLPLLVDVPIVFPRGGGCTLTFPVAPDDECLVIFADRCIDFWWQSGGIQKAVSERMHDLSDAFALVGPQSQARKISGISTRAVQLRTDDGAAFIGVAADHAINVTTPATLTATAQGGAEITAPTIILNGDVTINGNLSQGMGTRGGAAQMRGPMVVSGDVTANGISLNTHTHGGVQPGSGSSGRAN